MKKLKRACRRLLQDLYWELRGRWVRNPPLPARPSAFLFICKGNICRSPAAGLLAEKIFGAGGPAGLFYTSAGLEVHEPERSPLAAVQAGANWGIHLGDHRSVRLSPAMVDAADMVFAMEVRQLKELRRRFPAQQHRFFLLPLFGNRAWGYARWNLRDPYGKPVAEFNRCFQRLQECLLNLKAALRSEVADGARRQGIEAILPDRN